MKHHVAIVLACWLLSAGLTSLGAAADGGVLFSRCSRCHGDNGDKPPHILKGQSADALHAKLKGYAAGTYGGEKKHVMANMVKGLDGADMEALAAHITTFK